MKTLFTTLVLVITLQLTAQNPIEKNVGTFTTVKVYDLIHVNLIKSDTDKVVITGEDVNDVEVINKNGKLKIRMHIDKVFDGTKTFVEVHYTNLIVIDANEGAQIVANELMEQNVVELRTQEGGKIKVGLKVNAVKARAVTGGIIETSGQAKVQEISVYTGGIYEGKQLHTEKTQAFIRAGGEVDLYATEVVDAKIRAGGDIYIYGDPEIIQENRVFGGRIVKIDKDGSRMVID